MFGGPLYLLEIQAHSSNLVVFIIAIMHHLIKGKAVGGLVLVHSHSCVFEQCYALEGSSVDKCLSQLIKSSIPADMSEDHVRT